MNEAGTEPVELTVVDSHTEGEPTRVVIAGWPALHGETMAARRDDVRRRFDHLRRGVVREPRGHDAVVGALLTPPEHPDSAAGVIFFNDVGYLGMCGHGLIGVVRTLAHLGRVQPAAVRIDTPVGTVGAELGDDGSVTVHNVVAYRHAADVVVDVLGVGTLHGDVAYGGNWFFLTDHAGLAAPPLELRHAAELTRVTQAIRRALRGFGITGAHGAEIDHIELSGLPSRSDADSRNFVLCPGGAYDRSPCGTGTSAKMAVLHARGALPLDAPWCQESITGSMFTGWVTAGDGGVTPHIRGRAWITGCATLHFDPSDPFRFGITGQ